MLLLWLLGACVLQAVQIFHVLRNVGRHHDLSAGLAIGGSSLSEERDLIGKMAVLVGTPGRLLMHMTENPEFDTTHLQVLGTHPVSPVPPPLGVGVMGERMGGG